MEIQTPTGVLKNRIYSLAPLNFIKDLKEAISYVEKKYEGKTRFNGVPMINHVLEIAISLLEKGLDLNTSIATLLHEIELNGLIEEEIRNLFSDDVMGILNGIKKIKRGTDSVDTNPELIIKYVLNVSEDLR
ncbi:MAG TPA: HD domain-containing protein, partial [Candidatus Dojkabacteria bacterium]|nr:HD domain-containing protein [Candidatus Dojkabacteria bacterium]